MDDVQSKVAEAVERIRKSAPATASSTSRATRTTRAPRSRARTAVVAETGGEGYARVVLQSVPCGFCMFGDAHSECVPTLVWNNTMYVCSCSKCEDKIMAGLPEDAAQALSNSVESKSEPEVEVEEDDND